MPDEPTNGHTVFWRNALSAVLGVIVGGVTVWQVASSRLDEHVMQKWHDTAGLTLTNVRTRVATLEGEQDKGGRWTAEMQEQYERTVTAQHGRLWDRIDYVMRKCGVPDGKSRAE